MSELSHYGTPRHSGRYPWGSGSDPYQNNKNFISYVDKLTKQGLTEKQIAEGIGMSIRELRSQKTISKMAIKKADTAEAIKLKEKGLSNVAIGKKLGVNESVVRNLLSQRNTNRADAVEATADVLRRRIADTNGYLDVGKGTEQHIAVAQQMGITTTQLNTALQILKAEGYRVDTIKVDQLGTGHQTELKVLSPPGTTYKEITNNRDKIGTVAVFSANKGKSYLDIEPPRQVDVKRIKVQYGDEGGADSDGMIYLRRGVDDISLGNAKYAQVRVAVGDTHYLKGMAVYSDNIPAGYDIVYSSTKKNTGNPLDAMKPLKDDPTLPFGSVVRQKHYTDKSGKEQLSALNIVNEQGSWETWSRNISSQVLSKQTSALAKRQLELAYLAKRDELSEIQALTNPTIKKVLLNKFADGADASAVHLKAAQMPRQSNHVILPINSLKDNEVYAPTFRNGERVVLIRHPHGGTFEIPELVVNHKNREGRSTIGADSLDAIGINASVASRLSGADFDGDTVLVMPNNEGKIKTSSPLEGLKNFNPQESYAGYSGMKKMSPKTKQNEMGAVSNLITDMTIKGATHSEIARAVRHSMVVIDAEKHNLNYKQSEIDNGIKELKQKYQLRPDGRAGGASTLISRASANIKVPERKARLSGEGGPVDPETGERRFTETGRTYNVYKTNAKGDTVVKESPRLTSTTRMAETNDANTLSSGRPIERIYANHANQLKALANEARKEALVTKGLTYSPSANKTYAPQVESLKAKLALAYRNAPLERQAQLIAGETYKAIVRADPDMEADKKKKIRGKLLTETRTRIGAGKDNIAITPQEWQAIQSGAISNNFLLEILANTNTDVIREYATPRASTGVPAAKLARASAMLSAGYTQAEVADALGLSVSTLSRALNE